MAYQLNNNGAVYLTIANDVLIGMANNDNNQPLQENAVPGVNIRNPQLDANQMANLYAISQAAILTAFFSLERRTGHEIWWSPVMLSGLVSAAMIAGLLHSFSEEFGVMRGGRSLRNFLVNHWMWVVGRGTVLMMLLAIALCLLFSFTRLLVPRQP